MRFGIALYTSAINFVILPPTVRLTYNFGGAYNKIQISQVCVHWSTVHFLCIVLHSLLHASWRIFDPHWPALHRPVIHDSDGKFIKIHEEESEDLFTRNEQLTFP